VSASTVVGASIITEACDAGRIAGTVIPTSMALRLSIPYPLES
jgi:hypothetical protein